MKSHRRLISPENPFTFLKIILSDDTPSTGIRLPQKFTEEFGKYLLKKVTLNVPNGDVWEVGLHKSGDEIWLKNGWGRFAERYGLGFSHLLMFKYDGHSTFEVIIFNASASEIVYPKSKNIACIRNHVKHNARKRPVSRDDDDVEIVILDDDTSQEHGVNKNDEGECSRKRQRTQSDSEERQRVLEIAKDSFASDKPFVMVYISASHPSSRHGLYLPAEFRRKLLKGDGNRRNFVLQIDDDGKMKTYKVAIQDRYLRKADWLMFVEDNGIEVGDVCVFELIHKDSNVLGVTIFRSGP